MLAPQRKGVLLFLGFATGFLAALLGVGGGFILVPALVIYCGCRMHSAVRTSLAAIVPIALVGAISNYLLFPSQLDLFLPLFIIFGAITGSYYGTEFAYRHSHEKLRKIFALLLLIVAVRMLDLFPLQISGFSFAPSPIPLIILGIFSGMLSGMFGIGGGIVIVPALNLIFGLSIHNAILASLISIIPIALVGLYFHKRKAKIDVGELKTILPAALVGSIAGAYASTLLQADFVRQLFGLLLVIYSIKLLVQKNEEK